MDKLFSLEQTMIRKAVARLSKATLEEVRTVLTELVNGQRTPEDPTHEG